MKKIYILFILVALIRFVFADSNLPEIHSAIMLDAKFYSSDNNNEGMYNTDNRFQIRKAVFGLEGLYDEHIEYAFELGLSTCSGSGMQVQVMDAGLLYLVTDDFKLGIQQGHILFGFAGKTECSARLSLEKSDFVKTFGECHPLGFVMNKYTEIGYNMGVEAEFAVLNGKSSTFNGDARYNFGLIFETPLQGLALTGVYNFGEDVYYDADNSYLEFKKETNRIIAGIEYRNHNLWLTGEMFKGKGFTTYKQEMNAWYAQLGYDFKTDFDRLASIQPYVKYEFWDKNYDSPIKDEISMVESGINFKLSANTMVRCAYQKNKVESDNSEKSPNALIVRLQTTF